MTELPEPQGENKLVPRVQQTLELLAKSWVPLIAAVYASGYAIVSIYHASLGLNEVDAKNPRIATAGLLFLVFVLIAVYSLQSCRRVISYLAADLSVLHRLIFKTFFGALFVLGFDCVAVGLIGKLFHFEDSQPHSTVFGLTTVTIFGSATVMMMLSALFVFITLFCYNTQRRPRWIHHWLTLLFCGLFLVSFGLMSFPHHGQFNSPQVAWFLAMAQLLGLGTYNAFTVEELRKRNNWLVEASIWLLPLSLYSVYIYPHVRGAFGGGEATAAEIFLTTAVGSNSAKQFPATIIDETENGFYTIESSREQTRVRFIPRSQINSIEFDKPSGFFWTW